MTTKKTTRAKKVKPLGAEEAPVEEVVEETATPAEEPVEVVEEAVEEKVADPEGDFYPVVDGNGRFQAVPFRDGFVVYNNVGQRATNVITEQKAKDIVRESHRALGIKG